MKTKLWAGLICLLAFITLINFSGAQIISAQSEPIDLATIQSQFKTELRSVREEMLQQGIAFQEWKIKQLERELRHLTIERGQLAESEQVILRQLSEVEKSIEPSVQSEGQSFGEQEGMKAELSGSRLQGVRTRQKPLQEQEDALQSQLHEERQQLQSLIDKLSQLRAERRAEKKP